MSYIELFIIALGLAMDAFALALCIGLAMKEMDWFNAFKVSTYFGFFQGLMPLIGFLLARNFASKIRSIDHWIAFFLLAYIGFTMIKDAYSEEEGTVSFNFKTLFPLSIACSIDALAVGITFAFFEVKILLAIVFIGMMTCFISLLGVKMGQVFGSQLKAKANITGGIILITMAFKLLFEHLYF